MNCQTNKGFTLIEVMIALSVVAIGLMATLKAINQEISGSSITQNKMIALWLLQNKMTEIRLNSALPNIGSNQGNQMLLNQTWQWQTNTKATANEKIRKVEVSISLPAQDKLLSQTIYLGDIK
jgi:general secretion pathway protein I